MGKYNKAYYQAHKEESKKANRKWRAKNPTHPSAAALSNFLQAREEYLYQRNCKELEKLANR